MPKLERIREAVKGPLDADYIQKRQSEGWRLVGVEWEVEWERESDAAAKSSAPAPAADATATGEIDPPFGFEVAGDGVHLSEQPSEMEFLLSMMELIIQDISISKVADELNRRGFRTRSGKEWGPVAIFNMLPRLIELTPRIFSNEQWIERRKHMSIVY
jgi:recombinase